MAFEPKVLNKCWKIMNRLMRTSFYRPDDLYWRLLLWRRQTEFCYYVLTLSENLPDLWWNKVWQGCYYCFQLVEKINCRKTVYCEEKSFFIFTFCMNARVFWISVEKILAGLLKMDFRCPEDQYDEKRFLWKIDNFYQLHFEPKIKLLP